MISINVSALDVMVRVNVSFHSVSILIKPYVAFGSHDGHFAIA